MLSSEPAVQHHGASFQRYREKAVTADLRQKDRAALAHVREKLALARRAKRARALAARAACRDALVRVREQGRRARAELRATIAEATAQARGTCASSRVHVHDLGVKSVGATKAELAQLRSDIRLRRRAEGARRLERLTKREKRSESDDEVRNNIPRELEPVWRAVKGHIHAGPRITRTEAFLQWVHDNSASVERIINRALESDIEDLVAQEAAMQNPRRTKRERDSGRYAHSADRLCRCGHRLGEHSAEAVAGVRECFAAGCSCERFSPYTRKVAMSNPSTHARRLAFYRNMITGAVRRGDRAAAAGWRAKYKAEVKRPNPRPAARKSKRRRNPFVAGGIQGGNLEPGTFVWKRRGIGNPGKPRRNSGRVIFVANVFEGNATATVWRASSEDGAKSMAAMLNRQNRAHRMKAFALWGDVPAFTRAAVTAELARRGYTIRTIGSMVANPAVIRRAPPGNPNRYASARSGWQALAQIYPKVGDYKRNPPIGLVPGARLSAGERRWNEIVRAYFGVRALVRGASAETQSAASFTDPHVSLLNLEGRIIGGDPKAARAAMTAVANWRRLVRSSRANPRATKNTSLLLSYVANAAYIYRLTGGKGPRTLRARVGKALAAGIPRRDVAEAVRSGFESGIAARKQQRNPHRRPLVKGFSRESIAKNIKRELGRGVSLGRAVGIAHDAARKAARRAKHPIPKYLRKRNPVTAHDLITDAITAARGRLDKVESLIAKTTAAADASGGSSSSGGGIATSNPRRRRPRKNPRRPSGGVKWWRATVYGPGGKVMHRQVARANPSTARASAQRLAAIHGRVALDGPFAARPAC